MFGAGETSLTGSREISQLLEATVARGEAEAVVFCVCTVSAVLLFARRVKG